MEAPTESQSRSLYVQTDSRGGRFSPGLGISRVLPSSAALISVVLLLESHPVSGGLTQSLKSIGRAPIGWSEPVIQTSLNRLWLSRLRVSVEYS